MAEVKAVPSQEIKGKIHSGTLAKSLYGVLFGIKVRPQAKISCHNFDVTKYSVSV